MPPSSAVAAFDGDPEPSYKPDANTHMADKQSSRCSSIFVMMQVHTASAEESTLTDQQRISQKRYSLHAQIRTATYTAATFSYKQWRGSIILLPNCCKHLLGNRLKLRLYTAAKELCLESSWARLQQPAAAAAAALRLFKCDINAQDSEPHHPHLPKRYATH
jgi:hypothetical protein